MKQITPEIKAKIFALYFGQKIMYRQDIDPTYNPIHVSGIMLQGCYVKQSVLEVKQIESITEDHMRVCGWTERNVEELNKYHRMNFRSWNRILLTELSLNDYDNLRSLGYALPYMDWSVDDLVAAGVFKLKEGNNV